MFSSRVSGILLHPTSLPSRFGIGDLGSQAYRFIDFLSKSYQQLWQVLPLGPTGYGNSPYLCYSALAGNPLLISPEKLQEDGWLEEEDFANLPQFPLERVNYELVIQTKIPLLQKASDNFQKKASKSQEKEFQKFCNRQAYWLNDYALFMAIKEEKGGKSWNNWEIAIAQRKHKAIKEWQTLLKKQVFFHKFIQFQFFRQWTKLKHYANKHGISIFGDYSHLRCSR